eukprot:RCo023213
MELGSKKKNAAPRKRHKKQKSHSEPQPPPEEKDPLFEIEYITYGIDESDPSYAVFGDVFAKFQPKEVQEEVREPASAALVDEDDKRPDENALTEKPLSRKQRKKLKRLDVAQLKQLVARPDVVEVHDASAADPKLLVYLKSYRNTVAVPRHWSHKRKYLQGKRGIEKPPFELPAFIADTGISKIRENYLQREELKKQKHKAKDKIQPKMGKIDIDYQVLHDAFFKYQTKPKLTKHGDLYYEGKEFEVKLPEHRPGVLSERLKKALGMPDGSPPPWLINMQRHGPPPAYPGMKIPGLNAPIPPGASFGYHPGGWGKPPVDEHGMPLYGDVFGVESKDEDSEPVDKKYWGEMEVESEEEEADEDADDEIDEEGFTSTAPPLSETAITETTESATGTDTGTETPDIVQIKKFGAREEDKKLYQTLEQKKASVGANLMGSAYTYTMPKAGGAAAAGDVEVSLNPGEVEQYQDSALVQEKYDRAVEEAAERARAEREGVDQVYTEESRRR